MSEAPRRKLLVVVAESALSDKATIAFTLANASLSAGMEVAIFLTSDGVDLSRAGAAENAHFKPFKPLDELFDSFVAGGGKLFACGSCWHHRSMGDAPVAEGAVVSGVSAAVEWIAAGAQILSL